MNSMEKLVYTVISGIVPPETLELMKPENVRLALERVANALTRFNTQQEDILHNQHAMMEALNVGTSYRNRCATGSAALIGSGGGGIGGSGGGNSDRTSGSGDGARAA